MIYISALLGTFLFVFIRIKIEKQKQDDGAIKKVNWMKYFQKEWDDICFSLIVGQILVYFQESIFFAFVSWKEWDYDKALDFYVDGEQAIAGGMGMFGSLLILILFKYVVRKASKLAE